MKKLLFLFCVLISGMVNANAQAGKTQMEIDDALLQQYFKENKIKPTKTTTGIYYVITKKGTGENAKPGQMVSVNYTGRTLNGNVFDSNIDPQFRHVEPFSFTLGTQQVIAGWDQGIALLSKGAQGVLYIPSPLAYGAASPSASIPANSVMIFDVELVDVK